MRSLAVIVFIAIVGATGIYFANRPTVARGRVIAADLLQASPALRSLECDDAVPIGVAGATFSCRYETKDGERGLVELNYNREGQINATKEVKIQKAGDPWT